MKIVFASTPNQEEHINKLVRHIYSSVFPIYFTDDDIKEFEQMNVLKLPVHFIDINTLKEAFQVMTSLQTIISILESPNLHDYYPKLFNNNADLLQKYDILFPFEFEQFVEAKNLKPCIFSIYTKAANQILI